MSASLINNRSSNPLQGILLVCLGMACFVTLDTTAKYLLRDYPLYQVTWLRFLLHCVLVLVIMASRGKLQLRSAFPKIQLVRSCCLMTMTFLWFFGIRSTPLATATSILFLTPIIVSFTAHLFLAEKLGVARCIGVIVGFLGALIIIRPSIQGVDLGMLLIAGAALVNSIYHLLTRAINQREEPLVSLFYSGLLGCIVFAVLAIPQWQPIANKDFGLFAVLGAMGVISHLCLINAYERASATLLAPFNYSTLIWSTLFGYLIFSELPDAMTLLGAALIIGSGLMIFYREQRKEKKG